MGGGWAAPSSVSPAKGRTIKKRRGELDAGSGHWDVQPGPEGIERPEVPRCLNNPALDGVRIYTGEAHSTP